MPRSCLALAAALCVMPGCAAPAPGRRAAAPEAVLVLSSSLAGAALDLTLVEGVLRHLGKDYLVEVRGAPPDSATTGRVLGLVRARDIEGSFESAGGVLCNERGVRIVFDPPLDLPGGRLEVGLLTRVQPKATSGDGGGE